MSFSQLLLIKHISAKILVALLTIFTVSFIVFAVMEINIDNVATKVLGQFSTQEQRELWLVENGYRRPFLVRYFSWLIDFCQGDWGYSLRYRDDVFDVVIKRLSNTAIIVGLALALIIPCAIIFGTVAGMRAHSWVDRSLSIFSILSTSLPEFVTAVFLTIIFVYNLGWLPGTSSMSNGLAANELVMPTLVLWLYSMGYLMRITRSSVIQTMHAPYIRTAMMKGVPIMRLVTHHVLRNALIAPVTVIFLLIPYMLSGVVVVEIFFAYKGFGSALLEGALNDDIFLVEACAMITVVVVVVTQFLSDFIYTIISPRITFGNIGQ